MGTPLFLCVLLPLLGAGEAPPRSPQGRAEAVLGRASKERDLDRAGMVLSSLRSDEPALRAALSDPAALDERAVYILFGGHWGSRAEIDGNDGVWLRVLVDAISAKPELIRAVLRADRYQDSIEARQPRGAATINTFPFFASAPFADDLVERSIESLRRDATRPAEAITSLDGFVLVTAEQMEVNLLLTWQMLCGVCGRLDLIAGATAENWRGRFPALDAWFRQNRPYIAWDDARSCIRVDEDAREAEVPTPRSSRAIPELRPPWRSEPR